MNGFIADVFVIFFKKKINWAEHEYMDGSIADVFVIFLL